MARKPIADKAWEKILEIGKKNIMASRKRRKTINGKKTNSKKADKRT